MLQFHGLVSGRVYCNTQHIKRDGIHTKTSQWLKHSIINYQYLYRF